MTYGTGWITAKIKENKWFLTYVVVVLTCVSVFFANLPTTVKIGFLVVLLITQFLYSLNFKYPLGVTIVNWTVFADFLLIAIAYVAISVKDYDIAAITTLLAIAVVLLLPILLNLIKLWEVKDSKHKPLLKIIAIVLMYTFLAISMIILFGFLFIISDSTAGSEIIRPCNTTPSNTTLTGEDFLFYSGTVFYSSTFGDMVPQGFSRWLTLFECMVSYIFHVILLGVIVSSIWPDPKKDKRISTITRATSRKGSGRAK